MILCVRNSPAIPTRTKKLLWTLLLLPILAVAFGLFLAKSWLTRRTQWVDATPSNIELQFKGGVYEDSRTTVAGFYGAAD